MKKVAIMCLFLLIAVGPIALSSARIQESVDTKAYAVTSVAVVDVEKGQILPNQTVIITGGRIAKVAPQSPAPARSQRIMPAVVEVTSFWRSSHHRVF